MTALLPKPIPVVRANTSKSTPPGGTGVAASVNVPVPVVDVLQIIFSPRSIKPSFDWPSHIYPIFSQRDRMIQCLHRPDKSSLYKDDKIRQDHLDRIWALRLQYDYSEHT